MSASCQAPSAPSPPHLKPSHIRHGFSCLVIWIIRRDSTGFRCDILYICHRAFKYVPMPSGYPLYAAAKRMNPRCWRALMFFLFWKPRKVCTVLGTHTKNWPLWKAPKPTKPLNVFQRCCNYVFVERFGFFFSPCYSFTRFYSRIFYASRKKLFPESVSRNIGFQILQGLSFIHKHGRCDVFLTCHCNRKQMVEHCKIGGMAEP